MAFKQKMSQDVKSETTVERDAGILVATLTMPGDPERLKDTIDPIVRTLKIYVGVPNVMRVEPDNVVHIDRRGSTSYTIRTKAQKIAVDNCKFLVDEFRYISDEFVNYIGRTVYTPEHVSYQHHIFVRKPGDPISSDRKKLFVSDDKDVELYTDKRYQGRLINIAYKGALVSTLFEGPEDLGEWIDCKMDGGYVITSGFFWLKLTVAHPLAPLAVSLGI